MPTDHPAVDVDRILAAVREEARRRGGLRSPGVNAAQDTGAGLVGAGLTRRPALVGEPRHVRDFLALSTEQMLDTSYRRLLKRPPDPGGLDNFRRALRTGRRSKIEVLGLLRFSDEGKRQQAQIPGLVPAVVLAFAYRLPIVGWLLAGLVRVLGLPNYLQDRSWIERTAQEVAAELEI